MPPPPARGSRSRPARGDPAATKTPGKDGGGKDPAPGKGSADRSSRRRLGPGRRPERREEESRQAAFVAPPDIAIETEAAPVAPSLSSGVDAQTAKAMARYALERMSRGIRDVAEQIRAERTVGGEGSGDERPELMPGGTYRLVCDRCANSIADCFRHCDGCENDFCLECCAEVRRARAEAGAPEVSTACPHCVAGAKDDDALAKARTNGMSLKVRSFSVTSKRSLDAARAMPDPLSDLAALVDEYGDLGGKVKPEEDAKPCARCAAASNASGRSKRSSTASRSAFRQRRRRERRDGSRVVPARRFVSRVGAAAFGHRPESARRRRRGGGAGALSEALAPRGPGGGPRGGGRRTGVLDPRGGDGGHHG